MYNFYTENFFQKSLWECRLNTSKYISFIGGYPPLLFGYGVTIMLRHHLKDLPMEIITVLSVTAVALIIFFQVKKSDVGTASSEQLLDLCLEGLTLEKVKANHTLITEIKSSK